MFSLDRSGSPSRAQSLTRSNRFLLLSVLALGLLWIAVPSTASAVDRYVAAGGSGSSCTVGQPCSIQTGVGSAASGDTVLVAAGSYTVSAPLVANGAFTVKGVPGQARPQISNNGTGSTSVSTGSGSITWEKTTLVLIGGATAERLSVYQSGSNAIAIEAQKTTVSDSLAVSTGGGGIAVDLVGGSDLFPGSAVLRNSIVYANGSAGTGINGTGLGLHLRNLTVVAPGSGGDAFDLTGSGFCGTSYCPGALSASADAKSVIFIAALAEIALTTTYSGAGATLTIDHSNYRNGKVLAVGGGHLTVGAGNQSSDAVFVSGSDYHESSSSPTIDKGAVDAYSSTQDPDGNARTVGTQPDIGAYEYVSQPPPPPGSSGGQGGQSGGGGSSVAVPSIVKLPKSVKPGKRIPVTVACPDGCTLSLAAKIGSKKVKLPSYKVQMGESAATLSLPSSVTKKIRSALKKHKNVSILITPQGGATKSVKVKS